MRPALSIPAVLDAQLEPATGQSCRCFCGVRHSESGGVCASFIDQPGVRVFLNSVHGDGRGVPICAPCAQAWPDLP